MHLPCSALVPYSRPSDTARGSPIPLPFSAPTLPALRVAIDYRRDNCWLPPSTRAFPSLVGPFYWAVIYGDDVFLLPALDGVSRYFNGTDATDALLFVGLITSAWVGLVGPFARPYAPAFLPMSPRRANTARKSIPTPLTNLDQVTPQLLRAMHVDFYGHAFRAAVTFFRTIASSRRQHTLQGQRAAFRQALTATITYLVTTFRDITGRDAATFVADMDGLSIELWLHQVYLAFADMVEAGFRPPQGPADETASSDEDEDGQPPSKRPRPPTDDDGDSSTQPWPPGPGPSDDGPGSAGAPILVHD